MWTFPRHDGGELGYARTVASYLTHGPDATSVLFAIYTSTPWDAAQPKPPAAIIAALAAKPTSSSNSPSKLTPNTGSPDSATK